MSQHIVEPLPESYSEEHDPACDECCHGRGGGSDEASALRAVAADLRRCRADAAERRRLLADAALEAARLRGRLAGEAVGPAAPAAPAAPPYSPSLRLRRRRRLPPAGFVAAPPATPITRLRGRS